MLNMPDAFWKSVAGLKIVHNRLIAVLMAIANPAELDFFAA